MFNSNNRQTKKNTVDYTYDGELLKSLTYLPKNANKQIQETRNQKKEIRKLVNKTHENFLRDSFQSNFGKLYLTETKSLLASSNYLVRHSSVSVNDFSQSNIQEMIRSCNNTDSFNKDKLSLRINSIFTPRKETVGQFINQSRQVRVAKFLLLTQHERIIRSNENFDNNLGEINDYSNRLLKNRNLLINYFNPVLDNYIKHLLKTAEVERKELEKLRQLKLSLDSEIKLISSKIFKAKNILERFIEYRNFTICVKEKCKSLPSFFIYLTNDQINEEEIRLALQGIFSSQPCRPRVPSISPNVSRSNSPLKTRRRAQLLNQGQIDQIENENREMDRFKKYLDIDYVIFKDADDFYSEFKKLENENLRRLEDFNKMSDAIFLARREFAVLNGEDQIREDFYMNNIRMKEKILQELRLKNKNLTEYKNKISGKLTSNTNVVNNFTNGYNTISVIMTTFENINKDYNIRLSRIFTKVSNIKKYIMANCTEFTSGMEVVRNIFKLNKDESISEICLRMIKDVEKVLDCLIRKHKSYTNKKMVTKVENETIVKRKIENARNQKKLIEEKREEMRREIYEKATKVYVLHRRKVSIGYKVTHRNKRKQTLKDSEVELGFEDLGLYSDS